ncbi:MAG TPA: S41 family peptidase [Candidatus Binatia bacterium]|nr:S41 family peptidase [Candidatus Binatia bacterium]
MKTKLLFRALLVCVCLAATHELRAASSAELLEKGIYMEETRGDLVAASLVYKEIVDDPNAPRALAAQAQLRLGVCELKSGNKPKAIAALERLTQEFPEKDQLLALVDNQIPALLDEMVKQIEQNYIQEVDRSELLETAIRAIIGKLDSRGALGFLRTNDMEFLGTNDLADMNIGLEQQVAGIGAILKVEDGDVFATPMRGSPAIKAGIKAGDRIVKIDGTDVRKNQLAQTVKAMRGPAGSVVVVSVQRPGVDALLNVEVTRGTIRLPSVKGVRYRADDTVEFMLDEGRRIGYVRLSQVGKQSLGEMEVALKDLQMHGMKGLIFDLRSNPGGVLDEAITIADLFVENGTIVTVKSRSAEKVYSAKPEGTYSGFPMVLLVNQQTASAAEVIAGCLQDHGRATVIGQRTYGQAIVRSLLPLKTGGALKLPTAAYYRPNGKNVNRYPGYAEGDEWGIKPDPGYEVIPSDEEMKATELNRFAETPNPNVEDRQLQRALEYLIARLEKR